MAKTKSDDIYATSTEERGTYSSAAPHGPYQSNSRPSLWCRQLGQIDVQRRVQYETGP